MELFWQGEKIKKELESINEAEEINIATAFLEYEGVEILEKMVENTNIDKNNVNIYLRKDFSDKCADILERLYTIANIYI